MREQGQEQERVLVREEGAEEETVQAVQVVQEAQGVQEGQDETSDAGDRAKGECLC